MLSTRDIKRKIRTVRNIQQICKAMKTVSSIKLRKAEEAYRQAQPYAAALQRVVARLGGIDASHPLLEVRDEIKRTGLVAISADKGLAGSYNGNIIREAANLIRQTANLEGAPIGKRITEAFRRMQVPVELAVSPLGTTPDYRQIAAMADHVSDQYTSGAWDRVYLLYHRFGEKVVVEQLLPLVPPEEEEGGGDFLFEPGPEAILQTLLPRYIRTLVFTAALSASASEHAARVSAMTLATENADELIGDLTLEYNKSRQAAITRELLDIVGAAEALQ